MPVFHTEETKQKISKSHFGIKPTNDTRRKMSLARKGKKFSEESIKQRMATIAYKQSLKEKLKISCKTCSTIFETHYKNKLFCSVKCKAVSDYKNGFSGRPTLKDLSLTAVTYGAISELLVSADLMKKGYNLFRAMSANCYCDLIAVHKDTNRKLEVEVRTGFQRKRGTVHFNKNLSKSDNGNVNCFAVVEGTTHKIFYFDVNFKTIEI